MLHCQYANELRRACSAIKTVSELTATAKATKITRQLHFVVRVIFWQFCRDLIRVFDELPPEGDSPSVPSMYIVNRYQVILLQSGIFHCSRIFCLFYVFL
ncbi:hypothetical protein WDZ92_34370 [Nostoc sp. NIES-2111]